MGHEQESIRQGNCSLSFKEGSIVLDVVRIRNADLLVDILRYRDIYRKIYRSLEVYLSISKVIYQSLL